jgi:hypothetical protein
MVTSSDYPSGIYIGDLYPYGGGYTTYPRVSPNAESVTSSPPITVPDRIDVVTDPETGHYSILVNSVEKARCFDVETLGRVILALSRKDR